MKTNLSKGYFKHFHTYSDEPFKFLQCFNSYIFYT